MFEEDDIILSELNDEDLVAQMFDDLYDGMREEIEEGEHPNRARLDALPCPDRSACWWHDHRWCRLP